MNYQSGTSSRREGIMEKIMARVVINPGDGCWEWTGPTSGDGRGGGYGRVSIQGQTCAVHIVVAPHYFGFIPGRKQVDHTCNNRICCNPEHLEIVSHKTNQKRRGKRAKKAGLLQPAVEEWGNIIREAFGRLTPDQLTALENGGMVETPTIIIGIDLAREEGK